MPPAFRGTDRDCTTRSSGLGSTIHLPRLSLGNAVYFQLGKTNVRIAGSMHALPPGVPIPPWVLTAYEWSEQLYMETDTQRIDAHTYLPPGETADQLVPPGLWRRLQDEWPKAAPPLNVRKKLWVIGVQLAFIWMAPFSPGVESVLAARSQASGRRVSYLETQEEVVGLIDAIDNSVLIQVLEWLLDHPGIPRRRLEEAYYAWFSGELTQLAMVIQEANIMSFPNVRETMLDARNAMWLPRIMPLMSSKERTLIVVGAAHLPGPNGILALLQHRGYEAQRVSGPQGA